MSSKEKIAYLTGLIEGSDFEMDKKTKRVVDAFIDTLNALSEEIQDSNERIEEVDDSVAEVMGNLDVLNHTMMHMLNIDDDDDEYDEDDDEMYHITCPKCGEDIFIDDEAWDDGRVVCFECGQEIDLDDEIDSPFDDDDED